MNAKMKVAISAFLLVASAALGAPAARAVQPLTGGYSPSQTYPGPFVPNVVYYRNCPAGKWQRGLTGLYSQGVSCPDALGNFGRTGRWWGHFKPDGSCGPLAEPSEFALGNRLNYEASGQ